jgi:hypothetical protein
MPNVEQLPHAAAIERIIIWASDGQKLSEAFVLNDLKWEIRKEDGC